MAGLYVPLDVNYFEDDKIIGAGPMAELLYVRSLAFAKRARTNGHITANQLRSVAPRLTNPRRLADKLVSVGLWRTNGAGWYITAWSKRNPEHPETAKKSAAGSMGNHIRWHVPPDGTPKVGCPHCEAEHLL